MAAPNPYAKKPPRFTAASLRQDADKQPPRVIVHGVESVGKTTFAAFAPGPVIFLMGDQETGLLTLKRAKQVPESVSYLPPLASWQDVDDALTFLASDDAPPVGTLVIDTLGSLESLMHASACQTRFGGDRAKFVAYGAGENSCADDWRLLLSRIDAVRSKTGCLFVGLCHTRVSNFKNPEGPDYDRYVAQLSKIGWEATRQWADAVLFANFATYTDKAKGQVKAKASGGNERFLHVDRTAAYDAKNRYGLPSEISLGSQPGDGWNAFASAMGGNLLG